MNWWPFRRNGKKAAAERKAEAERLHRAAQRRTRHVQAMAPSVANLPPEEFAARVAAAFGPRRGLW